MKKIVAKTLPSIENTLNAIVQASVRNSSEDDLISILDTFQIHFNDSINTKARLPVLAPHTVFCINQHLKTLLEFCIYQRRPKLGIRLLEFANLLEGLEIYVNYHEYMMLEAIHLYAGSMDELKFIERFISLPNDKVFLNNHYRNIVLCALKNISENNLILMKLKKNETVVENSITLMNRILIESTLKPIKLELINIILNSAGFLQNAQEKIEPFQFFIDALPKAAVPSAGSALLTQYAEYSSAKSDSAISEYMRSGTSSDRSYTP